MLVPIIDAQYAFQLMKLNNYPELRAKIMADLNALIEEAKKEDRTYVFYCGACRQPFGAKRGATMCPLCESNKISLVEFEKRKIEQPRKEEGDEEG